MAVYKTRKINLTIDDYDIRGKEQKYYDEDTERRVATLYILPYEKYVKFHYVLPGRSVIFKGARFDRHTALSHMYNIVGRW